ncbi:MAG: metallophosphoesterase [Burkholderiaceae bacterium]
MPSIFFCGDTHGRFDHVIAAVREHRPQAIVFLGDLQPPAALDEVLAPVLDIAEVWWIPGNHDTDSDLYHDRLWRSSLAARNLHGRVAEVAGVRIAGLGGVFRGQVWMPPAEPNYPNAASFIARAGRGNLWRGGLPRRHRSTIFPSTYDALSGLQADVLITHEAPSWHAKGFGAIDRLARQIGATAAFHGHQHETRYYGESAGLRPYGVGLRGIVDFDGRVIVAGEDESRR